LNRLVVSLTAPRAHRTIVDALQAPLPPWMAVREILIEPGHYPGTGFFTEGNVVLTAVAGPGSVTLDGSTDGTIEIRGSTTLRGITVRNWSADGNALQVPSGNVLAEECEFVSRRGSVAVSVWGGGRLALRNCRVQDGAVVYSNSMGAMEGTIIQGTSDNAVALRAGSSVTVVSCRIEDAGGSGIWVTEGSQPLIERSSIINSAAAAILVDDRGEVTIRDALLDKTEQCGLVVRDKARALVEDTLITGAGVDGIWATTSGRITARRVRVLDGKRAGLGVDERASVLLEDCEVTNAGDWGIWVGDTAEATVVRGSVNESGAGVTVNPGGVVTIDGTTVSRH
jgi:hypothetical protein